jgi:hypothetical protein
MINQKVRRFAAIAAVLLSPTIASADVLVVGSHALSAFDIQDPLNFSGATLFSTQTISLMAENPGDTTSYTATYPANPTSVSIGSVEGNFEIQVLNTDRQQATFTITSISLATPPEPGEIFWSYDHPINAIASFSQAVVNGHMTLFHRLSPVVTMEPGGAFGVTVALPGDWSTTGSDRGNHQLLNINPAWIIDQNFVLDAGVTTFTAHTDFYDGSNPVDLEFRLIGAPIPEPSQYVLLLAGIAAVRCGARWRRKLV